MTSTRGLRSADPDDVAAIASLVVRRSPANRSLIEARLHALLMGPSVAIVVDDVERHRLSAALLLRPVDAPTGHWCAEVLEAHNAADESTLLPLLLSAAADRLVRSGVTTVVVPNDPTRTGRSAVLARASLQLGCWALVGRRTSCTVDSAYEQGLPLPHLHGFRSLRRPVDIRGEASAAVMTRCVMPLASASPLEIVDLLDPLIAADPEALASLLARATSAQEDPGTRLAITVSDGEDSLVVALHHGGFRRAVDWWRLDLLS